MEAASQKSIWLTGMLLLNENGKFNNDETLAAINLQIDEFLKWAEE